MSGAMGAIGSGIGGVDPFVLAFSLGIFSLIPFIVISTTCFLKIAVVTMLLRNALGLQQVPPNMALYSLSLMLTLYVMAPAGRQVYEKVSAVQMPLGSIESFVDTISKAAEPVRQFLLRNTKGDERHFFLTTTKNLWPETMAKEVQESDFLILVPSFMTTELKNAFAAGLILFLPFAIIDLVVANILLALGMMMVSPTTISLPLKILLFVVVDGWSRLISVLVLSYR